MVQQKTRNTGYVYDDGGRSQYFTGKAGDCVVRAVAIATCKDYKEVYKAAAKVIGYTPRNGIQHKDTKKVLLHFGGVWHPTMGIGTGCRVHLKADELPTGRIVCNCSRHLVAVIDGVIHDNHDPNVPFEKFIYDAMLKAFIAGADYAWNNPNWISVKDEQPPKTTDWANPKYFLGSTDEGGIHKMYRMGDPTICKDFENEQLYLHVTHWKPIVPPRKED